MIKDLGIKTGPRIVQTELSEQTMKDNAEVTKEPPAKIQLGVGDISYAAEMVKQQLSPVESEPKSLMDEIKKQRQAEQAERADVQEQQDVMGEMNKANKQKGEMSKSSSWWDPFHFFSR
jgi:hypothetical protein